MRRLITAIVIFSFLVTSNLCEVVFAQQSAKRIASVKIEGNKAISTATILNRIKIRPGDVFDESALNNEIKRLYAMGYFADVFVETEDRPEGVVVTFTVVEKPTIGKIEFRGNTRLRSPALAKKIMAKEGILLDFNILSQDVAAIRNLYIEQGYSNIKVDYKIETDPDTLEATVIFVVDEGLPLRIRGINVEGNRNITDNEIKQYMTTKTAWWFIQKGAFDDEKFQADLNRIRSVYRSKGFLDAQVTSKMDYSPDGKDMYITAIIDEGKEYLAGSIVLEGELGFPEAQIRSVIKLRSGDTFDYNKVKEDLEAIRSFYYDKGYMNADVEMVHKYNAATDRMDLIFSIMGGNEVYVGKINIIGNTKTKDMVIRRELRVYPGMKYDGERLKYSKERVYNLGFFEDVYFESVPTDDPNVKDLNVTVKESKTGEFSFGGGYSSVDAFIGFAQISQKNFDLLNFPTFTGGGQNLTVRAELGTARTNYFISWTDPWIFDFPFLFGFDLYRSEHNREGQYDQSGYAYNERRTGGSVRLGKEITDRLSTGIIYNLEQVKISNIPDDYAADLKKESGENLVSRATWDIGYDSRDNRYSPTRGVSVGLSLENAGGIIGGDKDFVKGFTYASFYHSIIENVVFELKGRAGAVAEYGKTDDVPIYERFYAGGATTIRGYKERNVGPRDGNIPRGGNSLVVGNAEVLFPIYKKIIKGAVFYDIGTVHQEADEIFKLNDYKQGAGVGVRVKTPIGPIKLDWGYPLSRNFEDKRQGEFYFSVSHGF